MGIRESVAMLVREVEAGRFMEATDAFYADDASTYELTGIVTVGKSALLAKERDYQATVESWNHIEIVDVLVDGQMATIHWKFEITSAGKRLTRDEIALQHWSGDGANARIVREQYFTATPDVIPATPPHR
ncbi:MAG TPA: nuclear transport factor 2 family protein [Gemmatimonadaceae bacterium]|nr:nuclear transport factor 2 family protein [Gemmatimonadaceae bacterium]